MQYESYIFNKYKDIIEEQLYLEDLGVSFAYTDTLDNQARLDLIKFASDWRKSHPKSIFG